MAFTGRVVRMIRQLRTAGWWGAVLLMASAHPLFAQGGSSRSDAPFGFGLRGINAQPLGDFRRYVQSGWGGGGDARFFPGRQRALSLRADFSVLVYGRQRTRECFGTGCRIEIDITTSNNIISGMVGPELQAPSGVVRPYVNVMAGITSFITQSSADGESGNDNVFETTNLRDNLFAAVAGGGVRVPLGSQVTLDLSARRHYNGNARYLTRDSFGDGTLATPIVRQSEVNMWTYAVGVAFGW
jgi:hypothetical protein